MNDDLRNSDMNIRMFIGMVKYLLDKDEAIKQFEDDTGIKYTPARTPIDQAVDDATGMPRHFIAKFAEWAAANYWGPDDAPDLDLVFDSSDQ